MKNREFRNMFSEYPDIVNMDELKNMLRIGKNKAYELINSGKISCIKMGRKNCIPKVAVINFLEDENNFTSISKCRWTLSKTCGSVGSADDKSLNNAKKKEGDRDL